MNYLQLAQRLRREMNDTGEGPFGVSNQKGRSLEYVDAIRESWLDIQSLRDWSEDFWDSLLKILKFLKNLLMLLLFLKNSMWLLCIMRCKAKLYRKMLKS